MNEDRPGRAGFISRLEAAQTSGVDVQLGPAGALAKLRTATSATSGRVELRISGGTEVVGMGDDLCGAFHDAAAKLRELECWVDVCGNCEYFVFSHMSY